MSEKEKYIGHAELAKEPKRPLRFILGNRVVKNKHIDNDAVATWNIMEGAITPERLNRTVLTDVILPAIHHITDPLGKEMEQLRQLVRS